MNLEDKIKLAMKQADEVEIGEESFVREVIKAQIRKCHYSQNASSLMSALTPEGKDEMWRVLSQLHINRKVDLHDLFSDMIL